MKSIWTYVALGTTAGIIKFLIPLIFPWMLRIVLDDIILKQSLPIAQRGPKVFHLVIIVLLANVVWMAVSYLRIVFTAIAGRRAPGKDCRRIHHQGIYP